MRTSRSAPKEPFSRAVPLDMVRTGTPEYAYRLCRVLESVWSRVTSTADDLQQQLDLLERERVYELWPEGNPYGSMDALTTAVIGQSLADLGDHIVAKRASERIQQAAVATTGEVRTHRDNQHMQIAQAPPPQNERASQSGVSLRTQIKLDQLARMKPDTLYQAVRAGRMSVNRAAIEAGFIHPTATVRTDDIDAVAAFLAKHFAPDDIRRIADRAVSLKEGPS